MSDTQGVAHGAYFKLSLLLGVIVGGLLALVQAGRLEAPSGTARDSAPPEPGSEPDEASL